MDNKTPAWWPWLRLAVALLAFVIAAVCIVSIVRGGGSGFWGLLIIAAFLGTLGGLYADKEDVK